MCLLCAEELGEAVSQQHLSSKVLSLPLRVRVTVPKLHLTHLSIAPRTAAHPLVREWRPPPEGTRQAGKRGAMEENGNSELCGRAGPEAL